MKTSRLIFLFLFMLLIFTGGYLISVELDTIVLGGGYHNGYPF
jgi:hypothetical protein